jgi:hypothetical protein
MTLEALEFVRIRDGVVRRPSAWGRGPIAKKKRKEDGR